MAYDEDLADRIRELILPDPHSREIKMFGGLCFTSQGNMVCGVLGDDLLLRVGPEQHEEALASPHARPMDFTGRPMKGFVLVDHEGTKTRAGLAAHIQQARDFVSTLPPKTKKGTGSSRSRSISG